MSDKTPDEQIKKLHDDYANACAMIGERSHKIMIYQKDIELLHDQLKNFNKQFDELKKAQKEKEMADLDKNNAPVV